MKAEFELSGRGCGGVAEAGRGAGMAGTGPGSCSWTGNGLATAVEPSVLMIGGRPIGRQKKPRLASRRAASS